MNFDRKIAASLPAENQAPPMEPGPQTQANVIEILGGATELRRREHKDWGHLIAHNFELRSLVNTTVYHGNKSGSFALDPGAFSYNIVRTTGNIQINLTKPSAIPDDQRTPQGKPRYRQRVAFLDLFYAVDTSVTFGPGCIFGRSGYTFNKTDVVDYEGVESVEYSLDPLMLDDELEGSVVDGEPVLRKAGRSDLLMVSYNERTAQATIIPLSLNRVGAADPAVPVDDGTEPGENDPDELPPDDGSGEYTDPETGEVLPVVRPGKWEGVLYALHSLSVSRSTDCGATWKNFPFPSSFGESPVDIVAGSVGVFVLTTAGRVYYAATLEQGFTDLKINLPAADLEIPIVNGNFESGSLSSWTLESGTEPQVLGTVYPPQRPGSRYYLSQDWGSASPQPFSIYQDVSVQSEYRQKGRLNLSFDAIVTPGDKAKVDVYELVGGDGTVNVKDSMYLRFRSNHYVAEFFATDASGNDLHLYMWPKFGPWGESPFYNGIWLGNATVDAELSGAVIMRVMKSDGTQYDGEVTVDLFDLDTPNGGRETLDIVGDFSYQVLRNTISIQSSSTGRASFLGSQESLEDTDNQASQLRLTFKGDCELTLNGRLQSGLGFRSPSDQDGGTVGKLLVSAETDLNRWARAKGEYEGDVPARVRVVVSNTSTQGVWIDNVRLTVSEGVDGGKATALSIFEDGSDVYLQDAGVVEYRPGTTSLQPDETPLRTVFAAERGPKGRVAADQLGVKIQLNADGPWAQIVQGQVRGVIATPDVAVLGSNGAVFGLTKPMGNASANGRITGDSKRLLAVTTSNEGIMRLHSWKGEQGAMAQQPVKASADGRGTVATDIGRYVGWSDGAPDIFWLDKITEKWRYGGGIAAGILKIVEAK